MLTLRILNGIKTNSICEMRMHLRIEKGAKNCNGSTKGIDGLNRGVKDKDGRDDD